VSAASVRRLAERRPWLFAAGSLVFWTLFWWVAIVWLVWRDVAAWRASAPEERLLRRYPEPWRERYGDEFRELLRESRADGRRVWFDTIRGGLRERLRGDRALAAVCLTFCWIPLFPQGVVALVMSYTGAPSRSWFVALYLPQPRLWAGTMILLGLALLVTGARRVSRTAR
jgi:hypothetical protein